MTAADGQWHLGIGDPTPVGWFTVVAYGAAAFACWRAHAANRALPGARTAILFWLMLAFALVALGVNKQLDLQTALTEIGRSLARAGGWYGQRHTVQIAFIAAVAALGAGALLLMAWLSLPLSRGRMLALGGTTFVACFVLIRAASFHHVDVFLKETVFGLRWNWILELSGIALVGAGAVAELVAIRSRGRNH